MSLTRLITQLKTDLNSKPAPGEVLNHLMEEKLKELEAQYKDQIDRTVLWIGSLIADLFIYEAKESGDITKHVPMALEYVKQVIKDNKIPTAQAEIILEIIATHHGGEQKFLESKLYKNADCFKFLLPEGVFHIFSAFYKNDLTSLKEAMEHTIFKIDEKYKLVDLNNQLKAEAKELYDHWQGLFSKTPYELTIPALYKKN